MSENTIIVQTTKGPVKGISKTSIVGEDYYRFRGIPYAQPPVGDLRFKVSHKTMVNEILRIQLIVVPLTTRIPYQLKHGLSH